MTACEMPQKHMLLLIIQLFKHRTNDASRYYRYHRSASWGVRISLSDPTPVIATTANVAAVVSGANNNERKGEVNKA